MIPAYDKLYLNDARRLLANCLDFAVNELGYDLGDFYGMFLKSDLCGRLEKGDPFIASGMSGTELALIIIARSTGEEISTDPALNNAAYHGRSKEYWCGWALAFYQWYTACSLRKLNKSVPISSVMKMYDKYHEMDITHFVDRVDAIRRQKERMGSYLKHLRKERGYSQSELARATNIPLKTLQHYEQGTKSLSKANAVYVLSLAAVLGCSPGELLDTGV